MQVSIVAKSDMPLVTPSLFPAISRRTDPATSHLAALEITASGVRGTMMNRALAIVAQHPGKTAKELESLAKGEDGSIRKRLNDLWRMGRILKGNDRVCSISGKRAQTWLPLDS